MASAFRWAERHVDHGYAPHIGAFSAHPWTNGSWRVNCRCGAMLNVTKAEADTICDMHGRGLGIDMANGGPMRSEASADPRGER